MNKNLSADIDDEDYSNLSDASNWGVSYIRNGIGEGDQEFKKQGQYGSMERFDPEYFILICELSINFYEQVEKLATNVQLFWRLIQQDSLDVYNTHLQGTILAEIIALVYKVYQQIETVQDGGPGSGKTQDFRVCYTFALLQKFLLNDTAQFELYIAKMNSHKEMLRLIKNNLLNQQSQGPEDTGFILCHGKERNFGEIILCNQLIRKQLGYSAKDLRHMNISNFMPTLIQKWHNLYVSDFSKNGSATPQMLNKTNCVFLKKKNGYIVPAMIHVKFHYSRDYDFTFVCFVSFMQTIQTQRSAGIAGTKIEDVLFMLCDDLDGTVTDVSESCNKQLGLSNSLINFTESESIISRITLDDICPSINFQRVKEMRSNAKDESNDLHEELVEIDLNIIHKLKSNFGGKVASQFDNERNTRYDINEKALCQIFKESYGPLKDKSINIVAIKLLDQLAMEQYSKEKRHGRQAKKKMIPGYDNTIAGNNNGEVKISQVDGNSAGSSIPNMYQLSMTHSESGGGSSASASHSSKNDSENTVLKQMFSSTEKTTSGSLKLVVQLVFLVYVILLSLSTLNLLLSLDRYQMLQREVMLVKMSYDRIQIHAKTRVLLRSMANQINGYGAGRRFNAQQEDLKTTVVRLSEVQEYLEKQSSENEELYKEMKVYKKVANYYYDPNIGPVSENQTYSYSMNLYIQRITACANWTILQFAGQLQGIRITNTPANYVPGSDERTVYYLIMTGLGNIRLQSSVISEWYRRDAEDNALDVAEKTLITIVISIFSIVTVAIIVSPVFSRIEARKYNGLKFFLNIQYNHIMLLDQQTKDFLALSFADGSVHTSSTHQEAYVISNQKKLKHLLTKNHFVLELNDTQGEENDNSSSDVTSSIDKNFLIKTHSTYKEDESDANISQVNLNNLNATHYESPPRKLNQMSASILNKTSNSNQQNNSQFDHSQEQIIEPEPEKKSKFKKYGKVLRISKQIQMSKQKIEEKNNSSEEEGEDEQNEEEKKKDMDEKEIQRQSVLQSKLKQLKTITIRQQIKTLIVITCIGLSFSSYFIAGFFFSVMPFQQTPEILNYLQLIFKKDVNVERMISFTRENLIFNDSIPSLEYPNISSADYYINLAMNSERDYLNLRKNIPSVFKPIETYLNLIETEQLCPIAFPTNITGRNQCLSVYNGLLQRGLSNSIAVILRHFQNVNMEFNLIANRDSAYLMGQLTDTRTLDLIDLKHFYIDQILGDMKDRIQQATTQYYENLIDQYTTLFTVFIVVMSLLFGLFLIFGYRNIRDTMWKTNLSLKIMPIEYIPRHCLPELKAFFKY